MYTNVRYPAENEYEVLEAVGVGIAAFESARSILSSGSLSATASTVNYIHANTPPSRRFNRRTVELKVLAHHPRMGIGTQSFWFRLSFEYNGNDIRNAAIVLLEDRSSRMFMSDFAIDFNAQPYSLPSDPVAEIVFQISGRWDPVGEGVDAFWGEMLVKADGRVRLSISSEQNWVWHDGFRNLRDQRVGSPAPAPRPGPTGKLPILKHGTYGKPVRLLQRKLNLWLVMQRMAPLSVDSDFGTKTEAAVKAFQKSRGLKANGIVGPKTWDRLLLI